MISETNKGRLLMISTDRNIFNPESPVALRQIEYAKDWEEVHIIVFTDKSLKEISLANNVWVYPTRSFSKWFGPFDAIRLGRFIIEKRGITEITCQDPFLTGMAGVSLKKQFNIPLEIQIHTDIGSSNFNYMIGNRIRKTMALSYLPKADRIRAVSNRIKNYISERLGIDEKKIIVRPIHVDVEKIKSSPIIESADLHKKYPKFKKIVLMASRLEREKNIGLALQAWAIATKKLPQAGLIIVGKGKEEAKLKRLVERLGITEAVIFEPWADSLTLASYYKTADLFLVTSLFEGYGMTSVEAHAAGCKIVSTDVGIAKEVGAKIVGWDERELADAIVYSLK